MRPTPSAAHLLASKGAKRILASEGANRSKIRPRVLGRAIPSGSKCLKGRAWAALSTDPLGGDLNGPFGACVLCSFARETDPFGGSVVSDRVWDKGMQGWTCVSACEKCGLKGILL